MEKQELLEENEKLKARLNQLENLLIRKKDNKAYTEIRLAIIDKVDKEIEKPEGLKEWMYKDDRLRVERKIMSDLKWDLHIRTIHDFEEKDIKPAIKYINNYVIPEELKKSRWKGVK